MPGVRAGLMYTAQQRSRCVLSQAAAHMLVALANALQTGWCPPRHLCSMCRSLLHCHKTFSSCCEPNHRTAGRDAARACMQAIKIKSLERTKGMVRLRFIAGGRVFAAMGRFLAQEGDLNKASAPASAWPPTTACLMQRMPALHRFKLRESVVGVARNRHICVGKA